MLDKRLGLVKGPTLSTCRCDDAGYSLGAVLDLRGIQRTGTSSPTTLDNFGETLTG